VKLVAPMAIGNEKEITPEKSASESCQCLLIMVGIMSIGRVGLARVTLEENRRVKDLQPKGMEKRN